jgi:monovalent cation:H+ antiporter, CPA1 family
MQKEITLRERVLFLTHVPGFNNLTQDEITDYIAPIITLSEYEPGQTIVQRGTIGQTVYFLYSGRAKVELSLEQGKREQFSIEKGEIFGEMALVSKERRSADVIAMTEAIWLSINIETFHAIMMSHWRITKAVASLIGSRRISRFSRSLR